MTQLKSRIQEIKERVKDYQPNSMLSHCWDDIPLLLEKLEKAVEVIEFYGREENWKWQETPCGEDEYVPATNDEGDKARKFLEEVGK